MLFRSKSQDIRYLNEVEIRRFLTGYAPKFNELVSAKCGNGKENQRSYERLDKKRRSTGLSPAERQQHSALLATKMRGFPQCQQAVEAGWRKEVFDLVMQEARENAASSTPRSEIRSIRQVASSSSSMTGWRPAQP